MNKNKIQEGLKKLAKDFNADEVTLTFLNRTTKQVNMIRYTKKDCKKKAK